MSKPEVGERIRGIGPDESGSYWAPVGGTGVVVETDEYAYGNEFQVQWENVPDDQHYYQPADEGIVWERIND